MHKLIQVYPAGLAGANICVIHRFLYFYNCKDDCTKQFKYLPLNILSLHTRYMFYPQRIYRYILVFCLVIFTLDICTAQSEKDSLLAVLKTTKVDTVKVQILHSLYVITDSVPYARAA